jgi:hypothetical protein
MAKSKRPQQSKRIGQSQPEGVARAAGKPATAIASKSGSASASAATNGKSAGASTPSASPSRLSGVRERTAGSGSAQTRRPVQRARYAQQPWWRRNLGATITITAVVVLVGAFVAFAKFQNNQAAAGIGDPVPAAILKTLTTIPASDFATVGTGTTQIQFQTTAPNTPLLTANGKPEVIYVGAEYCPYCAAERWGTVIALSRFGSFKGLELTRSTSNDVYPNTPTLSFRNATYTSQYVTFTMTETQDRNGGALATPPAESVAIFTNYDQKGSIPFMSYGNQYVTIGAPFFPQMLAGLDWQQVATQLQDPNSDASKAIISSANYQTAAICKLTNNKPGNVCNTSIIQQLESKLPVAK